MARPVFDRDKAIRVLVDAMHLGDEEAAKLHSISVSSVWRYRKRLKGAPELEEAARDEKQAHSAEWREQLRVVKLKVLAKVEEAAAKSDNLYHLSGALKILSDAEMSERAMDMGFGGSDGGLGSASAGGDRQSEAPAQAPRRALALLSGSKP